MTQSAVCWTHGAALAYLGVFEITVGIAAYWHGRLDKPAVDWCVRDTLAICARYGIGAAR